MRVEWSNAGIISRDGQKDQLTFGLKLALLAARTLADRGAEGLALTSMLVLVVAVYVCVGNAISTHEAVLFKLTRKRLLSLRLLSCIFR